MSSVSNLSAGNLFRILLVVLWHSQISKSQFGRLGVRDEAVKSKGIEFNVTVPSLGKQPNAWRFWFFTLPVTWKSNLTKLNVSRLSSVTTVIGKWDALVQVYTAYLMDGKNFVLLLSPLTPQGLRLHQDAIYILELVLKHGIRSIQTSEKQQINSYSLACQIAIDPNYATLFSSCPTHLLNTEVTPKLTGLQRRIGLH